MSIINDALKKAQKQGTADQKPAPVPQEALQKLPASSPSYIPAQPRPAASKKIAPMLVFLIIVIIAAGAIAGFVLMRGMHTQAATQSAEKQSSAAQPAKVETLPAKEAAASTSKAGESKQDVSYKAPSELPTAKTVTPAPPALVLSGIMYVADNPRALINDCIVCEGEMVSGAVVKKINPTNVVLDHKNTEITLRLKE